MAKVTGQAELEQLLGPIKREGALDDFAHNLRDDLVTIVERLHGYEMVAALDDRRADALFAKAVGAAVDEALRALADHLAVRVAADAPEPEPIDIDDALTVVLR